MKTLNAVGTDFGRPFGFVPPFCPNESCWLHTLGFDPQVRERLKTQPLSSRSSLRWFHVVASRKNSGSLPSLPYRWMCLACSRYFCRQTFRLEYWEKRKVPNADIFNGISQNKSNRQIARELHCSPHLIQGRAKKFTLQAMLRHTELTQAVQIKEAVAYDGLEAFAGSQYDPNQINQMVGSESLFIYDFSFVPLNRKGRMSEHQKIKNEEIVAKQGKYPPDAIRTSTAKVIRRMLEKVSGRLALYSDEHFLYRKAIQKNLSKKDRTRLDHVTISSKATRNYQNILFPVNHSDLLIRRHVAAFTRETICFSKTHVGMIGKFICFMTWKNYMRPQFVKKQKTRPQAHIDSPAMFAKVTPSLLSFRGFFNRRLSPTQIHLNDEWHLFSRGEHCFPRTKTS